MASTSCERRLEAGRAWAEAEPMTTDNSLGFYICRHAADTDGRIHRYCLVSVSGTKGPALLDLDFQRQ